MSALQRDREQGELVSISGKGCGMAGIESVHTSPHISV